MLPTLAIGTATITSLSTPETRSTDAQLGDRPLTLRRRSRRAPEFRVGLGVSAPRMVPVESSIAWRASSRSSVPPTVRVARLTFSLLKHEVVDELAERFWDDVLSVEGRRILACQAVQGRWAWRGSITRADSNKIPIRVACEVGARWHGCLLDGARLVYSHEFAVAGSRRRGGERCVGT